MTSCAALSTNPHTRAQAWTQRQRKAAEELARRELAKRANPERARHNAEIERCAADILYWIDNYCWTFDPREIDAQPNMRFILYPRQKEFIQWLRAREAEQKSGLAEKSRDVGFTWLCCAYAVHGWLFRPGFTAGFGSRKLELVDRLGDPASIFEKIRYLVDHLPDWMLPRVFDRRKHSGNCKITNPANGASITGEGGDQIGRGGRATIYFVDEAAFLEHPDLVDSALSATARVKIFVSTPNGPGNSFYRKRFGGKFAVFTFHWRDDPRKNDEWYAQQCAELDSVAVAQEIDIDYSASVEGICIPAKWVRAAIDFNIPGLNTSHPLEAGFDVADGGRNKSVFIPRRGPVVLEPRVRGECSATQAAWWAAEEAERLGVEIVHYDAIGVGTSVKGAWDESGRTLPFKTDPVKWGAPPTNRKWPSGKTSADMFSNLRAELAWTLRTRFEKTWQVVTEGAVYPPDELISIPNSSELIAQLSLPLVSYTNTGKIQLESKADMKKRGIESPDHFDALCYSEAPVRPELDFF